MFSLCSWYSTLRPARVSGSWHVLGTHPGQYDIGKPIVFARLPVSFPGLHRRGLELILREIPVSYTYAFANFDNFKHTNPIRLIPILSLPLSRKKRVCIFNRTLIIKYRMYAYISIL